MKTTTLQVLPTTSYGTPSGNYDGSSLDWHGQPAQAADYYGGFGGLQTFAIFLNQFIGIIRLEASLDANPVNDDEWFRIYEFSSLSQSTTNNWAVNITGNFTWVRAHVLEFTSGTITKLDISY